MTEKIFDKNDLIPNSPIPFTSFWMTDTCFHFQTYFETLETITILVQV